MTTDGFNEWMKEHNLIAFNLTVDPNHLHGVRAGQDEPVHLINFMPDGEPKVWVEIQHVTKNYAG